MYRYLLNFSEYKKHKGKTNEIGYLQGVEMEYENGEIEGGYRNEG